MEKFRMISKWVNDYNPRGHRVDGQLQERVEEIGILSEKEAMDSIEYFNKHLTNSSWIATRYEIDDDKYRSHELIMPIIISVVPKEEPAPIKKIEVIPELVVAKEVVLESTTPKEVLKVEEIFGPTKTIYIAKYIATQRDLGKHIQKINGRIPSEERVKILNDFNKNLVGEISITEAVARLGGVRYDKNGKEINIEFLDNIDHFTKEFILSKMHNRL